MRALRIGATESVHNAMKNQIREKCRKKKRKVGKGVGGGGRETSLKEWLDDNVRRTFSS